MPISFTDSEEVVSLESSDKSSFPQMENNMVQHEQDNGAGSLDQQQIRMQAPMGRDFPALKARRFQPFGGIPEELKEKILKVNQTIAQNELFFAQYLLDLSAVKPKDGTSELTEEQKVLVAAAQVAIRNVREFIQSQLEYQQRQEGMESNPFFPQPPLTVLTPVFDGEYNSVIHTSIFAYLQTFQVRYRDFPISIDFGNLQMFGNFFTILLSKQKENVTEHLIVFPQAQDLMHRVFDYADEVSQINITPSQRF